MLTAGNDTITGALNTLSADDRITDSSTTDNDVMNVTLNRAVAMDVTNIENININWDGFAAPTFDLDDVDGATVTITSARTGYLGNVTFENTGENNISAGAGVTGTLTVDAIEDASVTATVADTITITNADGAITVNAGAAETVSVAGGENITVVALAADDVTLETDFEVATVTLGVDAGVEFDGADDAVVNLNSAEDITVTIDAGSEFEVLNLGGVGTIDLDIEMVFGDFTEDFVITNGGDITLSGVIADGDISGITHDVIRLATAAAGAADVTVGADANLQLEVDAAQIVTFQMHADLDTASDSITLTLEDTQAAAFVFTTADQEIESVTVNITPNDDFDTDDDFTIAGLTGSNVDDGPATAFTIVSDDEDVNVALTAVIAATIDASGVAGEFDGNQTAATDQDMTVIAAAGASSFDFEASTQDSTFISGNDADDVVTFETTSGTATAQFAGGDNSVSTEAVITATGTLAVIGADGDETVTILAASAGTHALLLGDGDNRVTLAGLAATADVFLTAGSGDDTLTYNGTDLGSTLEIDLGAGTNRLVLGVNADLTAASMSISGLNEIELAAGDVGAEVRSSLLDGEEITILSSGANGTPTALLGVELQAADSSFDGSNLIISDSIASAVLGLDIDVTTAGTDYTIVGSEGSDLITTGSGDDTITGGAGADVMAGGTGNDVFVISSRADTKDVFYAGANLTVRFDAITDFVAGTDVIQLATTAAAYGTGITLSADTVIEVTALTDVNDFTSLTAFFAGIEAAAAADGVASTSALLQVYDVTLTADADATHFDGGLAGRYLIINDGTADLTVADMIIDITGITGALTADDFVIA